MYSAECGSTGSAPIWLLKMLLDRTLPAVASPSTVNVRLPVEPPVPAETVTALGFDDCAVSACQAVR